MRVASGRAVGRYWGPPIPPTSDHEPWLLLQVGMALWGPQGMHGTVPPRGQQYSVVPGWAVDISNVEGQMTRSRIAGAGAKTPQVPQLLVCSSHHMGHFDNL